MFMVFMLPPFRGYFVTFLKASCLVVSLITLNGCSSNSTQPQAANTVPVPALTSKETGRTLTDASKSQTSAPVKNQPIPVDTLYALLLAEMAGQRQQYDVALDQYLWQAKITRDPEIAERSARIAQFLGNRVATADALDIWLSEDPQNPEAHQTAAQLLMELGDFKRAIMHIERVQALSGVSQYDFVASNTGHLSHEQKEAVLIELQRIQKEQPNNANVIFAVGIMYQQLGQYQQALIYLNKALKLEPELLSAGLQKARVLALLDKHNDALKWLAELRKKNPNHKGILVLRARILLEQQNLEDARTAFIELHKQFPDDPAILLSQALLNDETGRKDEARADFYQLLAAEEHTNEAHFYLGRMDDEENNVTGAINHFSQVNSSREFLPAQLRAAFLIQESQNLEAAREYLQEQRQNNSRHSVELLRIEIELLLADEQYSEAKIILDNAINKNPNNVELIYTRAMLAERQNDIENLERDLRTILTMNPNHIDSLNALGYALADKTDRWTEALPLIQRALQLSPNNPAIIDSLGWVYFRMGDVKKALPLLEKAFSMMPDHEIAAHYGELLWITGDKKQAISVWKKGYSNNPDSDVILRTIERLQVPEDDFAAERN